MIPVKLESLLSLLPNQLLVMFTEMSSARNSGIWIFFHFYSFFLLWYHWYLFKNETMVETWKLYEAIRNLTSKFILVKNDFCLKIVNRKFWQLKLETLFLSFHLKKSFRGESKVQPKLRYQWNWKTYSGHLKFFVSTLLFIHFFDNLFQYKVSFCSVFQKLTYQTFFSNPFIVRIKRMSTFI